MNNSDSIREFFKRMADCSATTPRFDMLHNSNSLLPRSSQNEGFDSVIFCAGEGDFGIGLPPLVNR
ncbi:MAG: hypothetical protein HYX67_11450 [Candidatus Melainabacteria bacterium]|nr:hypothetical protein [Candidatus Melainabacteria bacterium]